MKTAYHTKSRLHRAHTPQPAFLLFSALLHKIETIWQVFHMLHSVPPLVCLVFPPQFLQHRRTPQLLQSFAFLVGNILVSTAPPLGNVHEGNALKEIQFNHFPQTFRQSVHCLMHKAAFFVLLQLR